MTKEIKTKMFTIIQYSRNYQRLQTSLKLSLYHKNWAVMIMLKTYLFYNDMYLRTTFLILLSLVILQNIIDYWF